MKVAACLAFRNAADYLREWLLFHLAAGVDYFYLYNNDSEDEFAAIVDPFVRRGRAEVTEWPGLFQQHEIYDDCLRRSCARSKREGGEWLAFIDDDEFLFDERGIPLAAAIEAFSSHAGVAIPWYLYGTSGKIHREPGYVISRFTRRRRQVDQHHKCVVQPRHVLRSVAGGHLFACRPPYAIVDQDGRAVTEPTSFARGDGPLRINHYLTKSVEEMIQRRTQRSIDTGERPKFPLTTWIDFDRGWNDEEDLAAQIFLPRMKALEDAFSPD